VSGYRNDQGGSLALLVWQGLLFLLLDPGDVLRNSLVRQERLLRVVSLGQCFLVGDQVMNTPMTILAMHEAALTHFLLAETVDETLLPMNPSMDQVVPGERLWSAA
jgi:hypothetical protein